MKQASYIATILLFLLTYLVVFGQVADSAAINTIQQDTVSTQNNSIEHASNTDGSDDDHFSPGLFFILMFVIFVALACIGAGMALTVFVLLVLFGLVSFGIISTSIIIGLYKKSFAKGCKSFVVLAATIGSLVCCTAGCWIFNDLVHWWTAENALLIGAASGLFAGGAVGLFVFTILQRLTAYFVQKLKLSV